MKEIAGTQPVRQGDPPDEDERAPVEMPDAWVSLGDAVAAIVGRLAAQIEEAA